MGFVKLEKQGHVGIVTIDRQEALNALNSQVLSDLDAVIDQVAADDEIYVMILTGAGRSFVAAYVDSRLINSCHKNLPAAALRCRPASRPPKEAAAACCSNF